MKSTARFLDPDYAEQVNDLEARVLRGDGTLDREIRMAAFQGTQVPEALGAYVDKVRRHAYKVIDRDVEDMRAAGYSDDQLFELTIATALGEARRKLDAGLKALRAES